MKGATLVAPFIYFIGNCFAIPIKQKSPPGDAHSRVRKLLLSQPRSARAFCEQNAFLSCFTQLLQSLFCYDDLVVFFHIGFQRSCIECPVTEIGQYRA